MSRRNKNKLMRNSNLAVKPPEKLRVNKKAEKVKQLDLDPYDESLKYGRSGYVLKSIQSNDYRNIAACIKLYREENPDSTYVEVYSMLHKRFPWIFEVDTMYSGNISKIINADDLWRSAYFCNGKELLALADIRVHEILKDEKTEPNTILSAYDKVNKWSLAKQQFENDKHSNGGKETAVFVFGDKDKWLGGDEPCILD